MKKCLIVINELSGQSKNIDEQKLLNLYSMDYEVTLERIKTSEDDWSPDGYDVVVVCGGDGTFNRTINKIKDPSIDIIYYSFGTFNECAKTKGKVNENLIKLDEFAMANKRLIGYVAATGSFTPLGYIVPPDQKKKFGIFAYIKKVIGQYKVYNIPATIKFNDFEISNNYTLIMVIDSKRCFGFKFNKLYKPNDGQVHVLLIRSPGKNSFINKVKIFFPLFKAFFIGLRKEINKKNIVFKSAKSLHIKLTEETPFDVDGDMYMFEDLNIKVVHPQNNIYIGNFDKVKKS